MHRKNFTSDWLQLCDFVLSMRCHKLCGDFVLVSELHSCFHCLELDALRFFYPLQLLDLNNEIR